MYNEDNINKDQSNYYLFKIRFNNEKFITIKKCTEYMTGLVFILDQNIKGKFEVKVQKINSNKESEPFTKYLHSNQDIRKELNRYGKYNLIFIVEREFAFRDHSINRIVPRKMALDEFIKKNDITESYRITGEYEKGFVFRYLVYDTHGNQTFQEGQLIFES